jgi:phosphoglycolate phosphatase-like HAD superfamily hydrolase
MELRSKFDKLLESTKKPVAIFDLDGTVFDVTHRSIEILKQFLEADDIQSKYPEQVLIAKKLRYQDHLYSLEATLNGVGIDRYSEHAAHFLHAAETFWFKHFFRDELLAYDQPYPGALECVKHLHKAGAQIVYLSGRDIPNMSRGTINSLEKHGFPHAGHGVTMCLKPAYGQDDLLFKKQSIETIASEGEVIFTIDNEPANVQMFGERFPKAMNLHFDTLYAKKLELKGSSIHVVKSFSELNFA